MRNIVVLCLLNLFLLGCDRGGIPEGFKPCDECYGRGKVGACQSCRGVANMICGSCGGSGGIFVFPDRFPCGNCGGSGRLVCKKCNGNGFLHTCTKCNGKGYLP